MKLKTKKIIAREILFLILCISASILFFAGTFGYNWYLRIQINNIDKNISKKTILVDSVMTYYAETLVYQVGDYIYDVHEDKKTEFLNKHSDAIELNTFRKESKIKLYNGLLEDKYYTKSFCEFNVKYSNIKEIEDLYSFLNIRELYTKTLHDFKEQFFSDILYAVYNKKVINTIESCGVLSDEIRKLNNEIKNNKEKLLTIDEQLTYGKYFLIILVVFLFGLRYLFYGTKWSIKTLKS